MFNIAGRIYKIRGKAYYAALPGGLIVLNWIIQRIFRVNAEVPFQVHYTSVVRGYRFMKIHPSVRLSFAVSAGCHVAACEGGELSIGENTLLATHVCIQTSNHDLVDKSKMRPQPVRIGSRVWLGHGVTVLPGVTLGDDVVVGANSVVTQSFPERVVVAGNPARVIKAL